VQKLEAETKFWACVRELEAEMKFWACASAKVTACGYRRAGIQSLGVKKTRPREVGGPIYCGRRDMPNSLQNKGPR